MCIDTGLEGYLAHLKAEGRQSLKFTKSQILHFLEFGNDLVTYILYLKLKGYTEKTIYEKSAAVKAYLRWLDGN